VKVLFNKAIDASVKADNHEDRLANLIETITKLIFSNVSRGIYEKEKLIFSLLI
jgi:dynein heavy chain